MVEQEPNLPRTTLRLAAEVVVALYVVVDAIIAPLFGPVMRFLSGLRLVQRLEGLVASLPPYVILGLLVVPFAVAELAKVYAVVLMAEEHFRIGLTIFIGAYVVSILVCERIFNAGKGQLITIGWFRFVFDWVMAVKAQIFGWVRGTQVWHLAVRWKQSVHAAIARTRAWLKAIVGARPRGPREQLQRR